MSAAPAVASLPANEDGAAKKVAEVPSGMEAEAAILEALAEVPTINKLHVVRMDGSRKLLTVTLSQRNLPANTQRKYTVTMATEGADGLEQPVLCSQPVELPADVLLMAPAPSGSHQLTFKSAAASDSGCSLVLQLWQGARVVSELLVPKALHGPLVNDGYFASGAAWSSAEDAVAYTAEVPAVEKTPAWGGPESLKEQAGPKSWRGVGPALEDWGELNTGKRAPGVYVLDLKRKEVLKVPVAVEGSDLEDEMSFGQPVWAADGSGLVLVGWPHSAPNFPAIAKKLGVVFCYNRPAYMYFVPCSRASDGALAFGPAVPLTKRCHGSALSPTFSPDGSQLLYISHDVAVATGTHGATAKLCKLSWPQATSSDARPEVLVDVVERFSSGDSFPGLYAAAMIDKPFLGEACVLLTTQWRSQTAIVAVNTRTGQVKALSPVGGKDQACYSLLAVAPDAVYAAKAGPTCCPQLVHLQLSPGDVEQPDFWSGSTTKSMQWHLVGQVPWSVPAAMDLLSKMQYEVAQVVPTVGDTSLGFESVNFYPKERSGPLPTIIAPHGGPHTAMTAGWYMPYAFMASLGYAVICPNYRGSTGFGQASLASLPGHIGVHDVRDCMAALQQAVDAGIADPQHVAVIGGSHGGFLTGHLLGQFPDAFKAGVLRNPVCNLSLMVGITDINDWCYVEVFGSNEGPLRASAVPSPADLARMFEVSPIAFVGNVKAPMFFMLGAKDRRVPLQDGLQYVAALKAKASGAAAAPRVMTFPEDAHGLDKPQTEFEQWLNAAWWLKMHGMVQA